MIPFVIFTIEDDNDREFMANIYYQYNRLIYSEVRKIVGDDFMTEDIVQDVLVRLINKLDVLKTLEKPQLASYVAETSKNTSRNHLRDQEKPALPYDVLDETIPLDENVELSVIRHLTLEELKYVWPDVRVEYQDLLRMKYIQLLSNEEIAKVYGVKPESIRMKLTRARREVLALLRPRVESL